MKNNYWLHRVSWHAELAHPLLDRGVLTIGFSDFALEDEVVDRIYNDVASTATLDYLSNKYWDVISRTRYSLKHFVNMSKGDYVVVPFCGEFSVYEVIDDGAKAVNALYLNDIRDWNGNYVSKNEKGLLQIDGGNKIFDIGFFRKVQRVELEISRSDYADEKLNRFLKARQTTLPMNEELCLSVDEAIGRKRSKNRLKFYSEAILKAKESFCEAVDAITTDSKLEILIAEYFKKLGADTHIPPKNERGKFGCADTDIIATFEDLKTIYYIQAKKHAKESLTDEWAVNQIDEYRRQKTREALNDDGYSRIAWVISTAKGYSEQAKKQATENNVRLINREDFATMLLNAGLSNFKEI